MGKQDAVATVAIGPDDNMSDRRADVVAAIAKVEQGDGVIVCTDLYGGTPSNIAISVMEETKAEVVTGVNMPLLIKLAEVRENLPLPAAVAAAREAGQKYINVASALIAAK